MAEKLTKTAQAAKEEMLPVAELMEVGGLSELYVDLKGQLESLEGKLAALKEIEITRMIDSGDEKVETPFGTWSISEGRKMSIISAKKLLERGVDSDDIEYATETREGDPFVVFRAKRVKAGE